MTHEVRRVNGNIASFLPTLLTVLCIVSLSPGVRRRVILQYPQTSEEGHANLISTKSTNLIFPHYLTCSAVLALEEFVFFSKMKYKFNSNHFYSEDCLFHASSVNGTTGSQEDNRKCEIHFKITTLVVYNDTDMCHLN